jgi:hypothetical protein
MRRHRLAGGRVQRPCEMRPVAQQPAREDRRGDDDQPPPDEVQPVVRGRIESGHGRHQHHEPRGSERKPAPLEVGADGVGHDERRDVRPDERRIHGPLELLHDGASREHERGGQQGCPPACGHAAGHYERQPAGGEHGVRGRIEKGQLELGLQEKSARQKQVSTTGRQGLHARPQRRQCPHARPLTRARGPIVIRSVDWLVILKEDADSSAEQGEIAPSGDDAQSTSWDRLRP